MTIHKSKGLEFPVVIYAFAEKNFSTILRNNIWIEADKNMNFESVYISKKAEIENYNPNAALKLWHYNQDQLLDEVNVLYVALTRAKEQLYILSKEMKPNKDGNFPNNLATFFIDFLKTKQLFCPENLVYEFGSSKRVSKAEITKNNTIYTDSTQETFPFENIKIANKEALMWGTSQQNAIEYGNTIHEILSYIEYPSEIESAIEKALLNSLISIENKFEIENTIKSIVNHKDLNVFFPEKGKILNEQPILKNNSPMVKPDRIVLQNKKAYLLDYKTGEELTKHKKQLIQYESVLTEMGYEVVEKNLVYIGNEIKIISI